MKVEIPLKPLSVNKAWQGRKYKSKFYKEFEADFCKVVPFSNPIEGEVCVLYVFYIKEYLRSDAFNFEKILSDLLTKRGYFRDDKYIVSGQVVKVRDSNERVEVYIQPYTKNGLNKLHSKVVELIHTL